MLNWTERIIRMRKEVPEIGWGNFTGVRCLRDPAVLALRYDWRNNSVLFLHNLHEQPREILVDPGVNRAEGKLLVNLLAEDHSRANESGKHRIVLEGYGYRWYRVGGTRLSAAPDRHRSTRYRRWLNFVAAVVGRGFFISSLHARCRRPAVPALLTVTSIFYPSPL